MDVRVVDHPLDHRVAAVEQVGDHLLELRLGQPRLQVLRPGLVGGSTFGTPLAISYVGVRCVARG